MESNNNLESDKTNNQISTNKDSTSEKILSNFKNSKAVEREFETLLNNIETFIENNFLKKEYYENLPDWSNPEIDNICNHSALDVENRANEWKWIFYMNPCITQTLYFVDKLKKEFPHLSNHMDLCIETLRLSKLNIHSVHSFIQIRMPNHKPIIIDFAHDNDVYVYQWPYTNRCSYAIKTESTLSVPVNSFNEKDTIFDVAIKWHMLNEWDFDSSSQELRNDFFSWILDSRKEQLKSHNTKAKFERWLEKNDGIRIFNLLHP